MKMLIAITALLTAAGASLSFLSRSPAASASRARVPASDARSTDLEEPRPPRLWEQRGTSLRSSLRAESQSVLSNGNNHDHATRSSAPCVANCDGSTTPPLLSINDFACFLSRYAAADPYANCDGSTHAPVLNANDFTCFLNKYSAGCS